MAGHCLCCSEGLHLKAFRNSVLHALKRWSPRNSVGRELLVDGFLVLRFKGRQPAVAYGDWSDDSDCADDLFRFLHVSQQVLIPYITCCQELICKEVASNGSVLDSEEVSWQAPFLYAHSRSIDYLTPYVSRIKQ